MMSFGTFVDVISYRAGLSNLSQLRAANGQLSLLTSHKSVANVNYDVSTTTTTTVVGREEKITNCWKLNQNITI